MTNRFTKRALLVPLIAVSSVTAYAQENTEEELEEVVVTGSRIVRTELAAQAPVQVLSNEDIELNATTNIGDYINSLPLAGVPALNRTNSNFTVNGSGLTQIDLRDLGASRTLTLVNGRRFVAGSPGTSAVDLNAIPTSLIERVELSTGGSSSVYGSDAVAGVVNFILKDDFEGFEINTRYEESAEGDGEETIIDLTVGSNFADGRGNAVVQFSFTDQEAVFSRDRERSSIDAVSSVFFGGSPFEQTRPFFSSFPPQGRFDVNGTGTSSDDFTFLPDGTLVNSFSANGDPASGRGADGFNRNALRTIALPIERYLVSSNIKYDINDNTKFFFEGTYANSQSQSEFEPTPFASDDVFAAGGLPVQYMNSNGQLISNPYLPQQILSAAQASGVDNIFFTRRLAEFGNRGSFNERQTYRAVVGFEGEIENTDLRWDISYNYGQSTQNQQSNGAVDARAFRNALLSERDPMTGQIRCVDADARADGCVPINIFGFNTVSQAALDFVAADTSRIARIEQKVLQANLTGTAFTIPSGDVKFAVGYEYRDESSDAANDPLTARGLTTSNAIPDVRGSFDVHEIYGELDIPIVEGGFVEYAGITVSGRASDYSTVGSTSSYGVNLHITPVDQIKFRGSYARATRAPNIDELFDPGGQTFAQVSDPCVGVTAATPGVVADNCRSNPDIMARIAANGSFQLTQSELQGTTGFIGGNPNLIEEEADTYTLGFVWTPELFDGVSTALTVDYFDIEVSDAIFSISQNNVLNLCYESVGLSSATCSNIVRFGAGSPFAGALNEVNSGNENVGSITTSGIDVQFDVAFDLDQWGLPGSLSAKTVYTYLDEYEIINLPGAEPDVETGEIGNAEHKWTSNISYSLDNLLVALRLRFIGESRLEDQDLSDEDCADIDCTAPAAFYTDMQVRYTFEEAFGSADLELFGGIRNMFDEDPPIISAGLTDSVTGTETAADVYDPIGRSYYIGAKVSF